MSIRTKLPLFISLLVAIALVVTGVSVYYSVSKVVTEQSHHELETNALRVGQDIDNLIKQEKTIAYALSQNKVFVELLENPTNQAALNEANDFLAQVFKQMPNHQHIQVNNRDGIIIADSDVKNIGSNSSKREYFKQAIQGNENISEVLQSNVGNHDNIIVIAVPIKNAAGEVIGILGNVVTTNFFSSNLATVKPGEEGYAFLLDPTGKMLAHPNAELINQPVPVPEIQAISDKGEKPTELVALSSQYTYQGQEKAMSYAIIPGTNWLLAITDSVADINAPVRGVMVTMLIILVVVTALAVLVGIRISRTFTKPIAALNEAMAKVADGDFRVAISIDSKDELGTLSRSLNNMVEKVRGLLVNMNGAITNLNGYSNNLDEAARTTAVSVEQTSMVTQQIAKAIESQASGTEAASMKVSALGVEIDQINEQSVYMQQNSNEIGEIVNRDKAVVEKLLEITDQNGREVEKIQVVTQELEKSSKNIGDITLVISGIAEQTNLLALNASIEAARAGDAGRGFAVVAEEIRKLAEQSTDSVKMIDSIIKEVQDGTMKNATSVNAIQSISQAQMKYVTETQRAFDEIINKIQEISAQILSTANALDNMNRSKEDVVDYMQNISASSEEVSASVEEVTATAEEQTAMVERLGQLVHSINGMSNELMSQSSVFKF
ncbi:methyl-accepting chemotaxis protein [Desulfitobacterium sp. THU1]|uniref:methyl-accepting chemotaxis protein n=1 Tax=Desulfitobacterium sp. THU1 TaxID=3138072 RepID=UPI00311E5B50